MCDRFSLAVGLDRLTEDFGIDSVHIPYRQRYNIAPTQAIPVIQQMGERRCLNEHRWGLMPYWGRSSVRVDRNSLEDKPYLRLMLTRKRCVVPGSGFYVWRDEGRMQSAWHAVRKDRPVFGMAGLYDVWLDSEKNQYPMCTVITTVSPRDGGRRPVMLDEAAFGDWLNPEMTRVERLRELLFSDPEAELHAYPVSPSVRHSALETPSCIAEIDLAFHSVKR